MKKLIMLSLLALLIVGVANAEPTYGLRAGLNISSYNSENYKNDTKLGFHGGLMMMYDLHPMVILQPELLFSQRGAQKEGKVLGQTVSWSTTFNYIEVPVMFKLNLAVGDLGIQPHLGPEFRYLLSAKNKDVVGSVTTTSDIKNLNDFDYGLGLGIDAKYDNFLVGLRYSMGMSKIYEKTSGGSQLDVKHNSIMLNLGATY